MKCVICGMESGIDLHHVIPQCYGGTNGETIPLCSGHHSQVHHTALELYRTNDESRIRYPVDIPLANRSTFLRLIRVIVLARKTYERARLGGKAPRKGIALRLSGDTLDKIDALKPLLSVKSQAACVEVLVKIAYEKMLTRVK